MNADDPRETGPFAGLTRRIIGVYYDVYNELGFGFLESVYHEAMTIALADAGLPWQREPVVTVRFRGRAVGDFRPDLVVDETIVVELKAARALAAVHNVQVLNYLRATPYEVGLLLNFGPEPQVRRLVFGNDRKARPPGLRSSA